MFIRINLLLMTLIFGGLNEGHASSYEKEAEQLILTKGFKWDGGP